MFNTDRLHRWLTVPAIVVLLGALVATGFPHLAVLMAPPVIALPFIAHAAIRGTDSAVATGLTATRAIGWLMTAWGLMTTLMFPPYGLIVLTAAILVLLTAGTQPDERRLAAVTILIGALAGLATILLAWIGIHPAIYGAAAVGLIAGGVGWLVEARRAPLTMDVIPAMTIAA